MSGIPRFLLFVTVAFAVHAPTALHAQDRPLAWDDLAEVWRAGGPGAPQWAQFTRADNMSFDGDGNLYVVDAEAGHIAKVGADGQLVMTIGRHGEGPGEFKSLYNVLVWPDGGFVANDGGRDAFHVFDADGKFQRMVRWRAETGTISLDFNSSRTMRPGAHPGIVYAQSIESGLTRMYGAIAERIGAESAKEVVPADGALHPGWRRELRLRNPQATLRRPPPSYTLDDLKIYHSSTLMAIEALLVKAGINQGDTPMSLLLNTVSAIQLCAGCTVEFEPMDTLGAAEDPAGVGMFADVLKIGDQGYLVSSDVLGGVVIVYDSEGRYQRELTSEGDGPGELRSPPQFAMGSSGIVLLPPASSALHLYSSDLRFNKTFQVPGIARAIGFDPVTEGWLVSYFGAGDGSEFGILLLIRAAKWSAHCAPPESPSAWAALRRT